MDFLYKNGSYSEPQFCFEQYAIDCLLKIFSTKQQSYVEKKYLKKIRINSNVHIFVNKPLRIMTLRH